MERCPIFTGEHREAKRILFALVSTMFVKRRLLAGELADVWNMLSANKGDSHKVEFHANTCEKTRSTRVKSCLDKGLTQSLLSVIRKQGHSNMKRGNHFLGVCTSENQVVTQKRIGGPVDLACLPKDGDLWRAMRAMVT